jgi:PKD repeat protein
MTPTHTFNEVGQFTIIQYASSDCGYDTTSLEITVYPAPQVGFSNPLYVCKNQPMVFENHSINTSGHTWDFGDGNTSQLNEPEHIFTEAGEYTVTLTGISNFNQCPASFTSVVTVVDVPEVSFDPSALNGCVPFEVNLTNTSQTPIFFQWDFGDENSSIGENPTHVYNEIGTYEITLVATDVNGCFNDTTISNIIVHPRAEAAFEFERTALCGLPAEIHFENNSTGATGFTWDFGNGNTTFNNDPTYLYSEGGDYQVELIATNQFSCADTMVQDLTIYPEPNASFEIEGAEGCEPMEVTFNNTSTSLGWLSEKTKTFSVKLAKTGIVTSNGR